MITVSRKSFVKKVFEDTLVDSYLGDEEPISNPVCVRAWCEILIPHGKGSSIIQVIETPGIYGVCGDSEEEIEDIYHDQCHTLEHMLTSLGVGVTD